MKTGLLALFVVLTFLSCNRQSTIQNNDSSDNISANDENSDLTSNQTMALSKINPEDCRIQARIIEIMPQSSSNTNANPCDKYPCRAFVEIVEIKERGSSFSGNITVGQKVKTYFKYTLHPTKESFPSKSPPLSGLEVNSLFIADFTGGILQSGLAKDQEYTISNYITLAQEK